MLLMDDELYQRHFEWLDREIDSGEFVGGKLEEFHDLGFCKLCEMLNSGKNLKSEILELDEWWYGQKRDVCFNKTIA